MADVYKVTHSDMVSVADAIRKKGGPSDALVFPSGFISAIQAIKTGGDTAYVNFYDYDGTLLYSYTLEEAQALTALPDGPVHDRLVFDGWNYSLENVKSLTKAMNIGAMYSTDDGMTRIYIHLEEGRTSPMLGICPNGTVTVDWGDGTNADVLTGTSLTTVQWTPTHHYASPGDYVIRLAIDGDAQLCGIDSSNTQSYILRYSADSSELNYLYQNTIRQVEIGSGIIIGQMAFNGCRSLSSITIPYGLTSIGQYAFQSCCSLLSITIPNGVTSIGQFAFDNCRILSSITIPYGITSIEGYTFHYCYGMRYYDFTSFQAIPTLYDTYVFDGISSDCEIRVPAALVDGWKAATNWETYADYVVGV